MQRRTGVGAAVEASSRWSLGVIAALALAGMSSPALAQAAADEGAEAQVTAPLAVDGPLYEVDAFPLQYVRENPLHVDIETLMSMPITFGVTDAGYVAPREGLPAVTYTLEEIAQRPVEGYFASAIQHILIAVRDALVEQDYLGVYVAPDPRDISEIGEDLRPDDRQNLTILITTGIVTEVRTIGAGERLGSDIEREERINHPLHQRIIDGSPIQPFDPETDDPEAQRDLLRRDVLDRYLFFRSRHLGRRVDVAVAAADDPGTVALDYMVTENRPLVLYAQVSNTGTKQTDYWRERLGFFHSQLTNHDDILSFDYVTAGFGDTHAVTASYERPFENERVRWRAYGSWSEFSADQVGFFGDEFTGESWTVGGEVIWNFYQNRELFVDLVGGVRYFDIEVDNPNLIEEGQGDYIIPSVGLRLDRTTEWFSTTGSATLEHSGSWNDIDEGDLNRLGRTQPDEDFTVLRGSLSHAFYLEPVFNHDDWADPSTPESSTLAHEILLRASGQYGFNDRLIPQFEGVAGGLYTVRGYDESVVAGDTTIIGSIEYRYHLPRAFAIEPEPRELFGEPFRTAPQYVYGRPDWDLILKTFVDAGYTEINDPFSFEVDDETLLGAGVGVEFIYRRNLNIRLDWGFALSGTDNNVTDRGSNRLHLVVTLLF